MNNFSDNEFCIKSASPQNTREIAKIIAGLTKPGDIYVLSGDLGCGKTVFAKGFAEGLGISHAITSPTFALINVYTDGRLPFYHFDVYRITDEEAMEDTGFEDYFYGDGCCLIEWGENIRGVLPPHTVHVSISKQCFDADSDDAIQQRLITITNHRTPLEAHLEAYI